MKYVYLTKEYIDKNSFSDEKKKLLLEGPWSILSQDVIAEYDYNGAFSRGEETYYNLYRNGLEIYQISERFIAPISEVRENLIKQILE